MAARLKARQELQVDREFGEFGMICLINVFTSAAEAMVVVLMNLHAKVPRISIADRQSTYITSH